MKNFTLLIFICVLITACSQTAPLILNVKKLDIPKMPTSYTFNVSKDQLLKTLKKEFIEIKGKEYYDIVGSIKNRKSLEKIEPYKYCHIFAVKDENHLTFEEAKQYNIDYKIQGFRDEYLKNISISSPAGFAYHYIFEGTEIHPIYILDLTLKIDEISEGETNVSILSRYPPSIAVGVKNEWNSHAVTYQDVAIYHPAESSTIEEYQILLRIGEALGVKDQMLPLILREKTKL